MLCRLAVAVAAAALIVPVAPAHAADPLAAGGLRLIGAAADGAFDPLPTPVGYSRSGVRSVSDNGDYVAFESTSDGLSGADDDAYVGVFVKNRKTGAVELASRGTDGAAATSDCENPSLSDDGRRVAFTCAGPLDAADTNESTDVYLRDLDSGQTTLVSRSATAIGDGYSGRPELSGNGAYVVFESDAKTLIAGTPKGTHVYRRAVGSSALDLVDTGKNGTQPDGTSTMPTISDGGNRVAFRSDADNLSAAVNDTNNQTDIYWRDFATSTTALASSVKNSPATPGDGASSYPTISGSGAFVAFASQSTNLGDGATNGTDQIHRRDLNGQDEVLISRADGLAGAAKSAGGFVSTPAISDPGDVVAFLSNSATFGANGRTQVVVRRPTAGTTEIASRATGTGALSAEDAGDPSVSDNGKVVAFRSAALTDDAGPDTAVFAREIEDPARPTTLVSRPAGTDPFVNAGGTATSSGRSLSADARYAVFTSAAAGLPDAHPAGVTQIWRRDNLTGAVVLVSRAGGHGAAGTGSSDLGTISADGNRIAFLSASPNLGPTAGAVTAFVRDVSAQTTTIASRAPGGKVYANVGEATISADGGHVAFTADSAGDGIAHVAVRTLATGTTVVTGGAQPSSASELELSGDGTRVVWTAAESGGGFLKGHGPAGETNGGGGPGTKHAFVADVGGDPTPLGGPSATASEPTISSDGRRVAFEADDALADDDHQVGPDVYVADLPGGAPRLVSGSRSGAAADGAAYLPRMSADGGSVAFVSSATNLTGDAYTATTNGFVRDLATGTTSLVATGDSARPGVPARYIGSVAIDADGGCLVFQTDATGLGTGLAPSVGRFWLTGRGTCPGTRVTGTPPTSKTPTPTASPTTSPSPSPTPTATVVAPKLAPPVVSSFTASRTRLRRSGKRARTMFSWTLDRDAQVRLVLFRQVRVKVKGRRRPVVRYQQARVLQTTGVEGANRLAFAATRTLRRGTYRASLTATSPGGTSGAALLTLKVRR